MSCNLGSDPRDDGTAPGLALALTSDAAVHGYHVASGDVYLCLQLG